jgi:hypothetical protein
VLVPVQKSSEQQVQRLRQSRTEAFKEQKVASLMELESRERNRQTTLKTGETV